jgi:hypothetical protein
VTPEEQAQVQAAITRLDISVRPIQVGDQISVFFQLGGANNLSMSLILTQDAARAISKAIKEGVEQAEVTLVKPQTGLVANA